jgi:uncharacterized protein YeaO (DUF488 family)
MGTIQIKRVYDLADKTDGKRILVDRLWPRGMKKESAHLDEWLKDVAPTTGLRKWFHHDTQKWEEFVARYTHELKQNKAVDKLIDIVNNNKIVTLLYAAHDAEHNHALVLLRFINEAFKLHPDLE